MKQLHYNVKCDGATVSLEAIGRMEFLTFALIRLEFLGVAELPWFAMRFAAMAKEAGQQEKELEAHLYEAVVTYCNARIKQES